MKSGSTCAPAGTLSACHDDGGRWARDWSATADGTRSQGHCVNCHGTFAGGWNIAAPTHVDPDLGNADDLK